MFNDPEDDYNDGDDDSYPNDDHDYDDLYNVTNWSKYVEQDQSFAHLMNEWENWIAKQKSEMGMVWKSIYFDNSAKQKVRQEYFNHMQSHPAWILSQPEWSKGILNILN